MIEESDIEAGTLFECKIANTAIIATIHITHIEMHNQSVMCYYVYEYGNKHYRERRHMSSMIDYLNYNNYEISIYADTLSLGVL